MIKKTRLDPSKRGPKDILNIFKTSCEIQNMSSGLNSSKQRARPSYGLNGGIDNSNFTGIYDINSSTQIQRKVATQEVNRHNTGSFIKEILNQNNTKFNKKKPNNRIS